MKHWNFFFALMILFFACQKESPPEELILSEVIIGKWQMIEIMGFPYSITEWEKLLYEGTIYEFVEDGTCMVKYPSLDFQPRTYMVNDSFLALSIFRGDLEEAVWHVTLSNNEEMIWGAGGFEGPIKQKY